MPVNTRESYIEIATNQSITENVLQLPAPIKNPASDEFLTDAERSATGALIAQQVGKTQYTTEIAWSGLSAKTVWTINRWFRTNGFFFYMKYLSNTDGYVKIGHFYRGNVNKITPSGHTQIVNGVVVPSSYKDFGFSIIDMGDMADTIVTDCMPD